MGLHMREKQAVTREIKNAYQKAGKKQKGSILDQLITLTGYNRKYAIRLLAQQRSSARTVVGGATVIFKAEQKHRPKNRLGKPIYTKQTIACLQALWRFHWYKCGSYLALIIRENIDALAQSREPDFHITAEIKAQLLTISGRQIDRLLKPAKDALRPRGISGTTPAANALLKKVPIRTHYSDAERSIPGFCQTDTVHHCGSSDSGQFNLTLTITDVSSGWIWLSGLLNKAHRWTVDGLKAAYDSSPFTILEFHSDNGSEFINHDTIDWWCLTEHLLLTRSRSYHKNDNCFAEQKNNAFVRNSVGYARFDTPQELAALNRVYQFLCPLANCFIPNKKLLSKTKAGSKTLKVYDKTLKTPYQRLMGSALSQGEQVTLSAMRSLLDPVFLQHNLNKAVDNLLAVHNAKVTFSKCLTETSSVTF